MVERRTRGFVVVVEEGEEDEEEEEEDGRKQILREVKHARRRDVVVLPEGEAGRHRNRSDCWLKLMSFWFPSL